jgi:hypothetical protein
MQMETLYYFSLSHNFQDFVFEQGPLNSGIVFLLKMFILWIITPFPPTFVSQQSKLLFLNCVCTEFKTSSVISESTKNNHK